MPSCGFTCRRKPRCVDSESHSFEPDIVQGLSDPMNGFINDTIALVANFRSRIELATMLFAGQSNTVAGVDYHIEADRLIVFIKRSDGPAST